MRDVISMSARRVAGARLSPHTESARNGDSPSRFRLRINCDPGEYRKDDPNANVSAVRSYSGPQTPACRQIPVTRMTSSKVVEPSASFLSADCRRVRIPRLTAISLIFTKSSARSMASRMELSTGSSSKIPVRP